MITAQAAEPAEKESLVVFAFAVSGSVDAAKAEYTKQYARDLFLSVKDGLVASDRFSVVAFDPRVAPVQRAVREQKVTEEELSKAIETFSGVRKAQQLGEIVGAELAVIGSIDSYTFQEDTGEARLTATVQVIDLRTGRVENTIAATGRAARVGDGSGRGELALGIAATQNAAEKFLADIGGATAANNLGGDSGAAKDSQSPRPSRSKKGLIPAMLGAIIVGFLISGG